MSDSPLLLVKTHAFGDALLCTPSIMELTRMSESEYWVLTGSAAAEIWERFPGISRVFVAPIPPSSGIRGGLNLLKWTLRNRSTLRNVAGSYVFQGSPMIRRWVRFLTGAPMRSSGGDALGRWETVFPMNERDYAGYSYSKTAGVEVEDWRPVFQVKDTEEAWAADLGLPAPLFAVAPGGGRNPRDTVPEKRWYSDRYAVIADRLSSAGFNIVLLGGIGDAEVSEKTQNLCGRNVLNMTGRTTWGQTAAILDRCSGFLGADSGAAHLAAARGIPSVVLFGPSSPETLFADGLINPVRGNVDCAPCYSNSLFPGCKHERAICMEAIETEEVWSAIRSMIDENYSG